jgi:hypothetical protein
MATTALGSTTMKYQNGDYEALHESPIWRDRADFILSAFLGAKNGKNEWEQLWGERVSETQFRLCCIPFFAKDLALGDEVDTDPDFVVRSVVRPSGNYTFRVWLGGQSGEVRVNALTKLETLGVDIEWSSENLLALNVSPEHAQGLADSLATLESAGELKYESGRS